MVSVGEGLLIKVLQEKRQTEFSSFIADWFKQHETEMFSYIKDYILQHGELPGLNSFASKFNLDVSSADNTYGYYFNEVQKRHSFVILSNMLSDASELLSKQEVDSAKELISTTLASLETQHFTGSFQLLDLVQLGEMVLDYAQQSIFKGGVTGITTGWPTLDRETAGFQNGDVYIIAGRPKQGKTTILLHSADEAYLAGYSPLFISMEMSSLQVAKRLFSKKAGIPSSIMKQGLISTFGQRKLEAAIYRARCKHPFFFIEGQLRRSIDELELLIQNIKPHIVYIDGAYLIDAGAYYRQTWERITHIVQRLKTLAGKVNIPIVATYQFNRGAEGLKAEETGIEHLQLADAIGQIASVVLGIFQTPPEDRGMLDMDAPYRYISFLAGREGESGGFLINWDWEDLNFTEIEKRKGGDFTDD